MWTLNKLILKHPFTQITSLPHYANYIRETFRQVPPLLHYHYPLHCPISATHFRNLQQTKTDTNPQPNPGANPGFYLNPMCPSQISPEFCRGQLPDILRESTGIRLQKMLPKIGPFLSPTITAPSS